MLHCLSVETWSPGGINSDGALLAPRSPQSGAAAAPVNGTPPPRSPHSRPRLSSPSLSLSSSSNAFPRRLLSPVLHASSPSQSSPSDAVYLSPSFGSGPPLATISTVSTSSIPGHSSPSLSFSTPRLLLSPPMAMQMRPNSARSRSRSRDADSLGSPPGSPLFRSIKSTSVSSSPRLTGSNMNRSSHSRRKSSDAESAASKAAQEENDSMVYLEGPCVYTCGQCRTHLTSHDDIISKSFHGRHGRAYLFDQCVNITVGPAEDRLLITGLHSVCDIFCKRCKAMVGWTYARAYEASQKYKEGKFIIEKINLYMEESHYDVSHPAGERGDRWRQRSMSWGSDRSMPSSPGHRTSSDRQIVYEYKPGATSGTAYEYSPHTPRSKAKFVLERTLSAPPSAPPSQVATSSGGADHLPGSNSHPRPPSPPNL